MVSVQRAQVHLDLADPLPRARQRGVRRVEHRGGVLVVVGLREGAGSTGRRNTSRFILKPRVARRKPQQASSSRGFS